MNVKEASRRVERDLLPLEKEILRHRTSSDGANREDLFYQASQMDVDSGDLEALISNSREMLRESQV